MADAPLGKIGQRIPSDNWDDLASLGSSRLLPPPRNPARAPQFVEDIARDIFVQPAYDIGMGVGSMAGGQGWNNPEAGAGLLAAMGLLTPIKAGAFQSALRRQLMDAGYHVYEPPNPNSLSKYLTVGKKSEFHEGVDPVGKVSVRIADHPGYNATDYDFRTVGGYLDADPSKIAEGIIAKLKKAGL